ncbi:MAG TPA: HAMP domain-containing sensor histidine kinase [Burkholderiales bacterium]|nr:HAMP domain-containing sensor histidine kinase [Burkholderiales bacterium]
MPYSRHLRSLFIALACSAFAALVRFALTPVLGPVILPYAFALGGVALSVYLAGWRASILTALVSPLWVNYLFVIPQYEFTPLTTELMAALASYAIIAVTLIFFGARERAAREQLQQALESADRANEAWRISDRQKDEFIAVLSHELRNPLGAISNATLVLRERCAAGELSPAANLLHRQVDQMKRLLDDLLDVARINRGLLVLERKPNDTRVCVQNAVEANAHLIDAADQELELTLPDRPVLATVDAPRITQIVSNLINNATKYAGAGARIDVRLEQAAEGVAITVRDNGAGIDPAVVPDLFKSFHNKGKGKLAQGLGLGLSISQSLARLHGGRITAASGGPGKGAEFRLVVPA